MTIDLKPEQKRVIDLAARSGAYQNPSEVLDQAFDIIREQLDLEDWMVEQREAVSAHIEAGYAQAERGELIDGDAAVEMLRQRRVARLKPQECMRPFSSRPRQRKTSMQDFGRWQYQANARSVGLVRIGERVGPVENKPCPVPLRSFGGPIQAAAKWSIAKSG